jgi:hypothetical protein
MPPTVTIDSGNGIQPLWATTRELLTPDVIERAERENREIEAALSAASTRNIDRLLWLPDTLNFPNRKKVKLGRDISRARVSQRGEQSTQKRLHQHLKSELPPSPGQLAAVDPEALARIFRQLANGSSFENRNVSIPPELTNRGPIPGSFCETAMVETVDPPPGFAPNPAWVRSFTVVGGAP